MVPAPHGPRFDTTRWSVVLAAGGPATAESRRALSVLCEQYWYPLYAYLRRSGHDPNDAEDLVQGFFLRLLEKDALQAADPQRGRFRSFLLASLKHFAANEWDRRTAQKRGGPRAPISLEVTVGEDRYQLEPRDDQTPDAIYERQWALTVLDAALGRLEAEFQRAGKQTLFAHLRRYLTSDESGPPYTSVAAATGMTEGALKVAVHRCRRRYRDLLREEIAHTVISPEEIQDEIRFLIAAAGNSR